MLVSYVEAEKVYLEKDNKCIFDLDSVDIPYVIDSTNCYNLSQSEISTHNNLLISILQNNETYNVNKISSLENNIWQLRTIYIAFLGIFSALIFSDKFKIEEKYQILIIPLFFILYMFYLDIHYNDLFERLRIINHSTSISIDHLSDIQINDKDCFNLNYKKLKELKDDIDENALLRKLHTSYKCGRENTNFLIHFVFYILPGFACYGFLFCYSHKKQKPNKS